jgi:hypothetical protein
MMGAGDEKVEGENKAEDPQVGDHARPQNAGDFGADEARGFEDVEDAAIDAPPAPAGIMRYFRFTLMLRFIFFVTVFGRGGDSWKFGIISFLALVTYLYQVGVFTWRRQAGQQPTRQVLRRGFGPVMYLEKFIVGFFASLVPNWQPPEVDFVRDE